MSLSDLASLGSFVSGLAVLVSLVFLYFQLRQVNRQVEQTERNQRALVQQGRAARLSTNFIAFAESDAASVYSKGMRGDELSDREFQQFRWMYRATMKNYEDDFLQHEEGLLEEPTFTSECQTALGALLATPGGRVMWHHLRRELNDRFREFADDLVLKTPLWRSGDDATRWNLAIAEELKTAA